MNGAVPSAATLEGVVVLGADSQIGLSVIRDLGRSGVPVFGIGRTRAAVGLHSRYLRRGYVHAGRDDALVELLNRIAAEEGARFLMTVSEGDILFLNRIRGQLVGLTPLVPALEAMTLVMDKARVCALAERLGIAVPRTLAVSEDGELAEPARDADFPLVLKWPQPHEVMPLLRERGIAFHKAEYCHDAAELDRALRRYRPLGRFPLVQAYCPGHGLGQMIYMHRGEAALKFQHRRLHEWPPEGGYSTLCESLAPELHPDLMAKSVALLREIGWEGPAMVEYRFDPRSGQAILMEINGRFWGSMPLAWHARARFPWLLYNLMGRGKIVPDAGSYVPGVRCKFLLPDLKRLLRIVFRPQLIQDRSLRFDRVAESAGFLVYLLNPASRYYVFSWDDPAPFLQELRYALRRLLPGKR